MGAYPHYYTDLMRRRFDGEPPLTPAQDHELALHLLICPVCAHATAQRLAADNPIEAQRLMAEVTAMLRGDRLIPYMREVAEATQAGREHTEFEQLVWEMIQRDDIALGRYRLIEADVYCRGSSTAVVLTTT